MEILDQAEEPHPGVGKGLLDARHDGPGLGPVDLISVQARVRELPLLCAQPPGVERAVGQQGVAQQRKEAREGTYTVSSVSEASERIATHLEL